MALATVAGVGPLPILNVDRFPLPEREASQSQTAFPSRNACDSKQWRKAQVVCRAGARAGFQASCAEESTSAKLVDWYEVLGVSRTATAKEVKAAYRQLVRRLHPDVCAVQDRQACTSRFLQVHEAYAVLSDVQARAAFDLQLSLQRFQASGYAAAAYRQGSSFSGYAAATTPFSADNQGYAGYGYGYNYGTYSGDQSQGFTSYASASYPSAANPCTQWKGKSWETDQCW